MIALVASILIHHSLNESDGYKHRAALCALKRYEPETDPVFLQMFASLTRPAEVLARKHLLVYECVNVPMRRVVCCALSAQLEYKGPM